MIIAKKQFFFILLIFFKLNSNTSHENYVKFNKINDPSNSHYISCYPINSNITDWSSTILYSINNRMDLNGNVKDIVEEYQIPNLTLNNDFFKNKYYIECLTNPIIINNNGQIYALLPGHKTTKDDPMFKKLGIDPSQWDNNVKIFFFHYDTAFRFINPTQDKKDNFICLIGNYTRIYNNSKIIKFNQATSVNNPNKVKIKLNDHLFGLNNDLYDKVLNIAATGKFHLDPLINTFNPPIFLSLWNHHDKFSLEFHCRQKCVKKSSRHGSYELILPGTFPKIELGDKIYFFSGETEFFTIFPTGKECYFELIDPNNGSIFDFELIVGPPELNNNNFTIDFFPFQFKIN